MSSPPDEHPKDTVPAWLQGVLWAEAVALVIALVMPLTPTKTGSTWSPANLFSTDPTYLEKVVASFVVVNLLLVVLGLAAWVVLRRSGSE